MALDLDFRSPGANPLDLNFGGGATTGQIKVWDGASWVAKPVKVWDGVSWNIKPMKFYNGSTFVTTGY